MELSKKTAKRIESYVKLLVKAQPSWLKRLFDDERIAFALEDNFMLSLAVDEKLDVEVKDKAANLIGKYIEKHPASFLVSKDLFH